jgi:hypothetical protein
VASSKTAISSGATAGAENRNVVCDCPPIATVTASGIASATARSDFVICERPPKTTKAARVVATVCSDVFSIVHLLWLELEHFLNTHLEQDLSGR